jgi:hypothetical protein
MALTAIDHDADVIGECERMHDKGQAAPPTFGGERFLRRDTVPTLRC